MTEISEVPVDVASSTPKPPVPIVNKTESDSQKPESAEKVDKPNKTDVLIVFGQGPVKPLLREEDLDPEMKARWEAFKVDPLHGDEPDFRVLEGEAFLKQLEGLTEDQQQEKLAQWQGLGRMGLNRWGRENALAAGFSLVSGYSEKVLLSGGKTIPGWAKDKLSPDRIEKWPSEAALMKDIIIRRFGPSFEKKYGKSIESVIMLEDASTNTLENLANSVNVNPDLLNDEKTLSLLATDFHIARSAKITALFAPNANIGSKVGAQGVLDSRISALEKRVSEEKGTEMNMSTYRGILEWMSDPNNPDLQKRQGQEERWTRGIEDPQYITYWFGYLGLVEDPSILQDTITRFKEDPAWTQAAKTAFERAGLSYDEISTKDLKALSRDEFGAIAGKLTALIQMRDMPPPSTA